MAMHLPLMREARVWEPQAAVQVQPVLVFSSPTRMAPLSPCSAQGPSVQASVPSV